MPLLRRSRFALGALAAGFLVFESATAYTSVGSRTFLYEVFEGFAVSYIAKFLGEKFLYAHMHFVYGMAALLHGLLLALLAFVAMLFVPKLSRRGPLLILVLFIVIDVALLTFLFTDPLGAHYQHWLFGA